MALTFGLATKFAAFIPVKVPFARALSQFTYGTLASRLPTAPSVFATPVFSQGLGSRNCLINHSQGPSILGHQPIRTAVKKFFPRPSEIKRVKRHGWKVRMSTPGGRAIIMRRMLKGRHVLTH